MQTRSEFSHCMWVGLWKIIGKPADIGHISGPGCVTGRDRRDMTEMAVPGTLSRDHFGGRA